jgi:hypothetical protein
MDKKKKKNSRPARASRLRGPQMPKPQFTDWRTFDPAKARWIGTPRLVEELVTYRDNLTTLLKDEGKYVVIKGKDIIGIYADRDEALQEAVDRFRDQPVLIMQIVAKELVVTFGGVDF